VTAAKFKYPGAAAAVSVPIAPDGARVSFGIVSATVPLVRDQTIPLRLRIGRANRLLIMTMLKQQLSHHVALGHRLCPDLLSAKHMGTVPG
jgi:hypothetical protein